MARAASTETGDTPAKSRKTRTTIKKETQQDDTTRTTGTLDLSIPWVPVLRRLADGDTPEQVADHCGLPFAKLDAAIKADLEVQWLLVALRVFTSTTNVSERLKMLRDAVFKRLESQVLAGNDRFTLWLADRMKVYDASHAGSTADEVIRILTNLTPAEAAALAEHGKPWEEEPAQA